MLVEKTKEYTRIHGQLKQNRNVIKQRTLHFMQITGKKESYV